MLSDTLLTGWIVDWPTRLLALIWLAWVISWVVASFWSGRTKTHVPTLSSLAYLKDLAGNGDGAANGAA